MNEFIKSIEVIESPHDSPCDSPIALIDAFSRTMACMPGPVSRSVLSNFLHVSIPPTPHAHMTDTVLAQGDS